MSAITISRQMGSQGDEVAVQIAQRLGWRLVGRALINQAAKAAGVPYMALADIDELGLLSLRPSQKEWRAYQSQVERIICELVSQGDVVIVGRGSQMVLRERPDVLHVRIIASLEVRVQWLQQEKHLAAEAARATLEASANARARYLRRGYGVRVDDPTLYHLIINTGLLSLPQAVNVVLQTFKDLSGGSHF